MTERLCASLSMAFWLSVKRLPGQLRTRRPAAAFKGRENVTPRNTLSAIDEVEIFSRALTGPATSCGADPNNEICDIFLADSAGKCKPGTPFTCDGTLYQTTAPSPTGPYTLYKVQTSPVQLLAIGSSFSLGTEFNALGYNPVDDYLYAINGLSPFQLYRIDASATVTNLGNVTSLVAPSGQRFNAGTFGPGGQYYVMSNLATPRLYRIDISTRVATLIGSPAVNRILDIAYNPADGQLYGRQFFNTGSHNTGQLFKINPTNAAATAIGGVTTFGRTGAIYFTALGQIIAYVDDATVGDDFSQETLVQIDPSTGALTVLGTDLPADQNDGASCPSTLLPVELTRFEATLDGQALDLRWETASETNNAGFEVQRFATAASTTWEVLGFVNGHGTTLQPQRYAYRVENMAAGRYRLRLKQLDFDGSFEYSPEVEVAVGIPTLYHLSSAYPNPFNPETQFSLSVARRQRVQVAVYDQMGRRVATVFDGFMESQTTHAFTFSAEGLPSGLYLVRVLGERFITSQTITLIK